MTNRENLNQQDETFNHRVLDQNQRANKPEPVTRSGSLQGKTPR